MGQTPSKKSKRGKDKGKEKDSDSPDGSPNAPSPSDTGSLTNEHDDDGTSTIRAGGSPGVAANGINVMPAHPGGTHSPWTTNASGGGNGPPGNAPDGSDRGPGNSQSFGTPSFVLLSSDTNRA